MRKRTGTLKWFLLVLFIFVFFSSPLYAGTLVLEGRIDEKIAVLQERVFSTSSGGLSKLTFRFASPSEGGGVTMSQTLANHKTDYLPKPDSITTEKDAYGNVYTVVTWTDLTADAVVKETFTATLNINLRNMKSAAPFPLAVSEMPDDVKVYLKPTEQVQTEDAEIKGLAASLTKGAVNEQAAVMAVLNWVVDNIKYKTPIPDYSAAWTLKTGHGNCQNYAHLSIALLRTVGIPARIVGGIALGKPWKVPISGGTLMQSIGQGGHAWMEVWYPDFGWVPFDAQQSHLFVGPRHIKQTVGLDSFDINDSWRAAPALPPFKEDISAEFITDDVKLALIKESQSPVSYVMTTSVEVSAPVPVKPRPVEPVIEPVKPPAKPVEPVIEPVKPPAKPVEPVIEPVKPPVKPVFVAGPVEFGNLDFPAIMDFVVTTDSKVGHKTFDKETSEYVTGGATFAQAFTVGTDIAIDTVSLAMHKFGGRLGSLWIDVVEDENGHPGMEGVRSMPLSLDTVKYHPGYKWFAFSFATEKTDRPVLKKGRYWVILRRSKDAIVNWYYTPGNQYGVTGDARSTASGVDWSNVMNYDFNFKVKGEYLKTGEGE